MTAHSTFWPATLYSLTLHRLTLRAAAMVAVVAALLWLFAMAPASAAPLSAAEGKRVRAVVQAQLEAFARDDAVKAFSFAAPNVRQALGTAEAFMAMVRRDYPVVYRPSSTAFLTPEGQGPQVIQRVTMTDAAGVSWLAVYSLEQQRNKTWRISGCVVVKNKDRMA